MCNSFGCVATMSQNSSGGQKVLSSSLAPDVSDFGVKSTIVNGHTSYLKQYF